MHPARSGKAVAGPLPTFSQSLSITSDKTASNAASVILIVAPVIVTICPKNHIPIIIQCSRYRLRCNCNSSFGVTRDRLVRPERVTGGSCAPRPVHEAFNRPRKGAWARPRSFRGPTLAVPPPQRPRAFRGTRPGLRAKKERARSPTAPSCVPREEASSAKAQRG
jgi:hypothetical protein